MERRALQLTLQGGLQQNQVMDIMGSQDMGMAATMSMVDLKVSEKCIHKNAAHCTQVIRVFCQVSTTHTACSRISSYLLPDCTGLSTQLHYCVELVKLQRSVSQQL